jgi:hypothetical protein
MKYIKWNLDWTDPQNGVMPSFENLEIQVKTLFSSGHGIQSSTLTCYGMVSSNIEIPVSAPFGLCEVSQEEFINTAQETDPSAHFDEMGEFIFSNQVNQ